MSLENNLLEWLNEQGYPLEMRVAKLFLESGFTVRQSNYYIDYETNTPREIDLIASKVLTRGSKAIEFNFVIECKNNKKPWVAFCSNKPTLHERAFIVQKCGTKAAVIFLEQLAFKDPIFNESILFTQPSRTAYNVTQAFDNNSDSTYAAIYTSAKASWSIIEPYYDYNNHYLISIPLVVIAGKLFESYLDLNGEFKVDEVPRSTLIWNNPVVRMPNTTILIETLNNLKNSIKIFKSEISEIPNEYPEFFTPTS
jgi:hypothetical protein